MAKVEGLNAGELKTYVEKIERLEEEMGNIRADVREIYKEAKEAGYDPKIMRVIIRLRKLDEADRSELDEITDTYRAALNV
jgi:uncharacterized protein (UPF0335 family)